jgi:hypothetical protein
VKGVTSATPAPANDLSLRLPLPMERRPYLAAAPEANGLRYPACRGFRR